MMDWIERFIIDSANSWSSEVKANLEARVHDLFSPFKTIFLFCACTIKLNRSVIAAIFQKANTFLQKNYYKFHSVNTLGY